MTRANEDHRGALACRAVSMLWWLVLLSMPMTSAQPADRGQAIDGSEDTQAVLRQAEEIARRSVPASPEGIASSQPISPALPGQEPPGARLYVLVSFSMPPASLHKLAAQATALQIPLVLRGMVGESLSATAARAAEVVDAVPGASFEIDPAPFSRFGVTRVPSFVIAAPSGACVSACAPDQAGDVLTGDVSLDYALERLARGEGTSGMLARELLARWRMKP